MITDPTLKGMLILFVHENSSLRKGDEFMERLTFYLNDNGVLHLYREHSAEEIHAFVRKLLRED